MVFPFPHLGSPQDPPLVLNDAVQAYQIGNGSMNGAELACRWVCVRHRGRCRRTVSVKSDRVQRTEAVSWTIRGRKLMWNEFSEHVQPVGNFGQVVLR